jgi:hypothetical protein
MRVANFREVAPERRDEFVAKGYKQRHFFPHRIYYLPKCGPDGYLLARWMCGEGDPNRSWELVLYAVGPVLDEFPPGLFFDDDLIWHRQQFGRPGQVATVNLALQGRDLYSMAHLSDLVQRIPRRREHKTRVEKRFDGWNHMLLNGILNFALERGVERVHTPTASFAMRNTDPARTVQREMFERVYDRNVQRLFPARRDGEWWTIEMQSVRARIVVPELGLERLPDERTICLCHDIERGFGHTHLDDELAAYADQTGAQSLEEMLAIEDELGCRATYNLLGLLFEETRSDIDGGGHCIAFHSYDHEVGRRPLTNPVYRLLDRWWGGRASVARKGQPRQLNRCRKLDYRIKGYRPPNSRITSELSDSNLCLHNFEWLASGVPSLRGSTPRMENRLVKIPILIDDFDLYRGVQYDEWEKRAIEVLGRHDFGSVCLHDCYARFWLPHYRQFLARIQDLGRLRTLDEVAAEVTFANAA